MSLLHIAQIFRNVVDAKDENSMIILKSEKPHLCLFVCNLGLSGSR
jgi:hypothetical protein